MEPELGLADTSKDWDGATVRAWLGMRVAAARSDQAVAQRGGRAQQDDCDKATAEELVCSFLKGKASVDDRAAFAGDLKQLLERDDYVWPGVFDDARFDRHVRSYIRKLIKMMKTNDGFDKILHYQ